MSLSLRAIVAVGGLGGGVLVPWSLSKLRAKGSETVNIAQVPSSVPSAATRTEESSIKVLEVPSQAPDSHLQEVDENWQLQYIKRSTRGDKGMILKQY